MMLCIPPYTCQTSGDVDDLSSRLQQLALHAAGAPLMTVETGNAVQQQQGGAGWRADGGKEPKDADAGAAEDWELV